MKGNVVKILLFSSMLFLVMAGCSGKNGNSGVNGTNGTNGINSAIVPFLSLMENNPQQVSLSWTQVYGATGYNVYTSTTQGGPYTEAGTTSTGTVTAYVVHDLTPGTTYYFVVTALLSSGESPYSNVVSFRSYALSAYPSNEPVGIAIDADGNILVTNVGDYTVSELSPTGTPGIYQTITTYDVGSDPYGIAIDQDGNVLVTNYGDDTVSELSPTGTPGVYQTNTTYDVGSEPYGIAVDAAGNVWVVNYGDDTVSELSPTGTPGIYQTITTYDVGYDPVGVAIDAAGNVLVANECVNSGNCNVGSVTQLSPTGTPGIYQTTATLETTGEDTYGIAVDKSGNVLVVNECVNSSSCDIGSVTEFIPDGSGSYSTYTTYTAGIGYEPEGGIAVDNAGNVWITNYETNSSSSVGSITELSPINATDYYYNATYELPGYGYGIAIDASGNIFVTDYDVMTTEFYGLATGPQFWPYTGPVFPGNGMW